MSSLFAIQTTLGMVLVAAIWVTFLVSLLVLARDAFRYYALESEELETVKSNFNLVHNDRHSIDEKYRILVGNSGPSIIGNRLDELHQLAQSGHPIDTTRLSDGTQQQEAASFTGMCARYAIGGMLLLGLSGFSYGWYHYVANDMAANELLAQAHLRSALAVGVWAVLCSLLFSIVKMVFDWAQSGYFAKMERFSNTHLAPLFQPISENKQMELMMDTVRSNTDRVNKVVERLGALSSDLTKDFSSLQQFSQTFQKSVEHHSGSQAQLYTSIDTLAKIVGGYRQQIDQSNDKNLQVLETLRAHNQQMTQVNQRIYEQEFNMGDWLKEIIQLSKRQQEEFQDQLKNLLDLTRTNLSGTQSTINRFGISIKKFESSLDTLQNHLSHFNAAVEKASDEQVEQLKEIVSKLGQGNISTNSTAAYKGVSSMYADDGYESPYQPYQEPATKNPTTTFDRLPADDSWANPQGNSFGANEPEYNGIQEDAAINDLPPFDFDMPPQNNFEQQNTPAFDKPRSFDEPVNRGNNAPYISDFGTENLDNFNSNIPEDPYEEEERKRKVRKALDEMDRRDRNRNTRPSSGGIRDVFRNLITGEVKDDDLDDDLGIISEYDG